MHANIIPMAKFISGPVLYETVRQKSFEAKETFWVCSPLLGLDAHEVFSQETTRNPPVDMRFVFRINEATVKKGVVNPYEVQFFMEHFKNGSIRTHDAFHSAIYVFDNSALIASADLTKTAFQSNIEAGVLLDEEAQVNEAKNFFNKLWETAKPVKDLQKHKKTWNASRMNELTKFKGPKPHTRIEPWKYDYVDAWYFSIPSAIAKRAVRKIQKATNWPKNLRLIVDIGPSTFKQVKLGDIAIIADLTKKRATTTTLEFARIFDKSRVETDEGDLHFAYETENVYQINRNRFYSILKNASIEAKSTEILLNRDQGKTITAAMPLAKARKRRRKRTKTKAD
jgi:hypothetical protein